MDTWDPSGGASRSVADLAGQILELAAEHDLTGLSVTGGEPFQQADAVVALIDRVRDGWSDTDVLIFTGYASAAARRISRELWERTDALVSGPYRRDLPSAHPLLGSGNQVLERITSRGVERFGLAPGPTRMQVSVAEGALHLVGMPAPGDLDVLRERLAERGIRIDGVSWDDESAETR